MENPNRNRRIFIIVFILFVSLFVYISYDMSSRTTAPWNKPKQLERALPGVLPEKDTLGLEVRGIYCHVWSRKWSGILFQELPGN
jgi:hypothetical protein